MPDVVLETPRPLDTMYMSRGEEVDPYRPLFTGDVYMREGAHGDDASIVIILQHPCALRIRGVDLVPNILVATVGRSDKHRSDWNKESMRVMPLPDLLGDGAAYSADFVDIRIISSDDFGPLWKRIAILSELGVNLLSQRWVHHNSRVIVKTITYNEESAGPFHEADLAAEWCMSLDGHQENSVNLSLEDQFHNWIRQPWGDGTATTRQQLLDDPQQRAAVRRALTEEIRNRLSKAS